MDAERRGREVVGDGEDGCIGDRGRDVHLSVSF